LVTGGAGFIGSHLVDALSGSSVRVLDNLSTGTLVNLNEAQKRTGVEFVHGDICDATLVREVMSNIDVVFHLACRGVRHSIGNPRESHEVNATGTLTLLQAAREAGVKRFVHVSSSEVYGTARYVPMDEQHACFPETVYGGAKLAGEAYARAYHQTYKMATTVVRPFNNFGPRSHFEGDCGEVIPRFILWALNGRCPIVFGDGSQTRDFIYVEETAHWLKQIACCDALVGKTINLGSGVETTIQELARIVYEEAGCQNVEPDFRDSRPGDVLRLCANAAYARELLGFDAATDLRMGIRKTVDYFRQHGDPVELLKSIEDANWQLPGAESSAPRTCLG
jgi:UDP-glucose 4-epimerase